MLRYPSRALPRLLPVCSRSGALRHPVLLTPSRRFTDKVLIGSCSSFLTCSTTTGLFHLLVTPISPSVALATLATAAASGALCVVDGGSLNGTTFGAVVGIFIGAMGGFYAKSQKEPWRK
ncbi:conserved hypothetical protein [Leishmania major strain Friedlin]|uniref:Uncharacterized protein n=1 Tax=Leishmania major TaxID=5664 RepID=Q4Q7V0_LEIMA|nr:conserved hypothetical protein [Leishmania major strain Friedlin]CAG9578126.1 hypothetical_protein_-_conserved [Leishmania major strain Friedlin]CAJ05802.1 conserved hypothetical protein [Leishmania major strain Friedlin]|eukprot:XP_001684609.1 conserved hypothetical protein [Leishmania major strain Friedlin]